MTHQSEAVERIVAQLRQLAEHNRRHFPVTREPDFIALGDEAAATITRLSEENERLRSALEAIVDGVMHADKETLLSTPWMRKCTGAKLAAARAALTQGESSRGKL